MKIYLSLIALVFAVSGLKAQDSDLFYDFESLKDGKSVLELNKEDKFTAWKETSWTVVKAKGKGNKGSNKFIKSSNNSGLVLAKYKWLAPGSYTWTVAVKVEAATPKQRNFELRIMQAKNSKKAFASKKVNNPKNGEWIEYTLDFEVTKGQENCNLQIFRWPEGSTIYVDDFKLNRK